MHLIDTHCHLDAAEFVGLLDPLLQAAQAAGIGRIVVPSVARSNFVAVQQLCELHAQCHPAYGIHPMFTDEAEDADLEVLRTRLREKNVVAVGEIGLDCFIDNYDLPRQEHFFTEQLRLAREFDLPVLLHTRRAIDTVLKHLRRIPVCGGIAHAFSGSRQQADEFIKLGFKLGIGGTVTYPRATRLRDLATTLPLSWFALETDAPDMPPEFVPRGQPNKPEYLLRIAQQIAQLRGVTVDEVVQATTQNALAVLRKLPQHSS